MASSDPTLGAGPAHSGQTGPGSASSTLPPASIPSLLPASNPSLLPEEDGDDDFVFKVLVNKETDPDGDLLYDFELYVRTDDGQWKFASQDYEFECDDDWFNVTFSNVFSYENQKLRFETDGPDLLECFVELESGKELPLGTNQAIVKGFFPDNRPEFQCDNCDKTFRSNDGEECTHCHYVPRLDGASWFNEKYPNASCQRCNKKVTGSTVAYCGGAGGACEAWYCEDCHCEGTADCTQCHYVPVEADEDHECDENDCPKCRRGIYCDCCDDRCPHCSRR